VLRNQEEGERAACTADVKGGRCTFVSKVRLGCGHGKPSEVTKELTSPTRTVRQWPTFTYSSAKRARTVGSGNRCRSNPAPSGYESRAPTINSAYFQCTTHVGRNVHVYVLVLVTTLKCTCATVWGGTFFLALLMTQLVHVTPPFRAIHTRRRGWCLWVSCQRPRCH
jgi:hypothetical protein